MAVCEEDKKERGEEEEEEEGGVDKHTCLSVVQLRPAERSDEAVQYFSFLGTSHENMSRPKCP